MFDMAKIDEFMQTLERSSSDDELRRHFNDFNADYNLDIPADPFSELYRDQQFELYKALSGKAYSTTHEQTVFDIATSAVSPFPYCHGSCDTVGDQLMAIGFLIKALQLPKGAKILEFGPGWGNTTLMLAKMGFDVTCVDIEKNFCDLITERASMEKLSVKVINGDFSEIEKIQTKFDAILFFECFHHASDHIRLIGDRKSVV